MHLFESKSQMRLKSRAYGTVYPEKNCQQFKFGYLVVAVEIAKLKFACTVIHYSFVHKNFM